MRISDKLTENYTKCYLKTNTDPEAQEKVINLGLRLGGFLSDAGWFAESEKILLACKKLCLAQPPNPINWCRTLDCCHK